MPTVAKALIFIGIALIAVGAIVWGISKLGIGLGNLPGDIHVQNEKSSFYFPVATSIIISIILTILLNLFFWLKK